MKILADFKQEVAEKYEELKTYIFKEALIEEAAELYAEYRVKEVHDKYAIGHGMAMRESFEKGELFGYNRGWNEALHWAAENAEAGEGQCGEFGEYMPPFVVRQSILKGLKP